MFNNKIFDFIIIGSGAAGVAAAYQLAGRDVLLIDVGYNAERRSLPPENIYDLADKGYNLAPEILGDSFEALHNLDHTSMSPKLKGPLMRFITKKPHQFSHDEVNDFQAVMSFAAGGLANAWGAGVMRFTERELEGFPYSLDELTPHYDKLTEHMGITGCRDDLTDHLGTTEGLHPPLPLSAIGGEFYALYEKKKLLFKKFGITVGRTRGAILSREHEGRPAYQFDAQDFFQPNKRSIYHPGYTLEKLRSEKKLEYLSGFIALRYEESHQHVTVHCEAVDDKTPISIKCRKLLIASGALNSARLVLSSNYDYTTHLPLLDNPVSFIPFIIPWRIGKAFDRRSFSGGELLITYPGGHVYPEMVQGSFYNLNAPLRSDLLAEFPLSLGGNIAAARYLLPALAMIQVFYPDKPQASNYLRLKEDLGLIMRYSPAPRGAFERHIIKLCARIGYLSLPFLCKYPAPGSSIHYAGTLPMKALPDRRYQTDSLGKLFGHNRVHIIDAATFPHLPAKNLTFTIMANAMRIAASIVKVT